MIDATDIVDDEIIDPVTGEIIDQKELAERLLRQAKEQGVSLVGSGGLLSWLTKSVLETALEAELTEYLGHEHGGTPISENIRNGTRTKTVLAEIGPVEIEVPRDRDGSFEPVIVPPESAAEDQFEEFASEWGERYPAIVQLWKNSWAEFVSFLEYDVEIRRVICTTNAIELINARYRRAVRARGYFPNEAAALKRLYLVTRSLDPTGGGRARWVMRWQPALNAFAVTFAGRFERTSH